VADLGFPRVVKSPEIHLLIFQDLGADQHKILKCGSEKQVIGEEVFL